MTFNRYFLLLISLVYLSSCDLEKTAKMKSNLPKANGKAGQIMVEILAQLGAWLAASDAIQAASQASLSVCVSWVFTQVSYAASRAVSA